MSDALSQHCPNRPPVSKLLTARHPETRLELANHDGSSRARLTRTPGEPFAASPEDA